MKPYISKAEYDKLVSDYYQVRNTDDYSKFSDSIQKLAEEYSLRLPENAPLQ